MTACEMAAGSVIKGGYVQVYVPAEGRTRLAHRRAWIAHYEGVLKFGDMELPCAVLQDGTRVLSQRAFTGALGAPQGGHAFAKRSAGNGVAGMPIFMANERLKPFIDVELAASLAAPIEWQCRECHNASARWNRAILRKAPPNERSPQAGA